MTFFGGLDFEQALDVWLRENDMCLIGAEMLRELAEQAGIEITDDSDRRAWVLKRKETKPRITNSPARVTNSPVPIREIPTEDYVI